MNPNHLPPVLRWRDLSPAWQWFLELCREIFFGRIENLVIQNGEPLRTPLLRVIREHKFGGENDAPDDLSCGDFALKSQMNDLLERCNRIRNGTIDLLEVKHGLPFRMFVPHAAA